ncbi:hypothetical protein PHMEG_0009830 [Phytophthora megakarya]|uniref:Uncharacterized protein n=1 Tax=Phytophthora megakarya TaxID=4795 RepID=A0A225WHA9_9STRA|nr:hypothetical protein PHMEG_0009830 [Phytophthora megakarya]
MMQLNPGVSKNHPSRKIPFQTSHALQYGLLVVAKDVSGAVSCVQCQFCQYFGREMVVDGKRKRTQNCRRNKPPYRTHYYVEHNKRCHPVNSNVLVSRQRQVFLKSRKKKKLNEVLLKFRRVHPSLLRRCHLFFSPRSEN